ncbi:maleylpyruvate isomerase family mycothiol-dependent enzyme [Streptomyces albidochromogenes]|uniref:maleylpyruvate isomerase family mycothiol-dependent enzyme n=1 Tax=Streptomyces albidochromogenes TaxID=329524 RepID=UPI002FEB97D8
MNTAEFIESLDLQGQLMAAGAEKAGPDAEVPTCPGWQVRDLLRHTGVVHRWATAFVTAGHKEFHPEPDQPDLDGDALTAWFREGHTLLVAALRAAPEDLDCWTFFAAPSPLAFWARRQAHETAIHRVDAEAALGPEVTALPVEFAADGVDELLRGFHARDRSRVRTGEPRVLRVRPTDYEQAWTVRLSEGPPRTELDVDGSPQAAADCELSGPAERLYLTLWNRLPHSAIAVSGDEALARLWRETSQVV